MKMTDFFNMSTEELLAQKAQLGDDFQAQFPKVVDRLKDPVSGIIAPRIDVGGSALKRLLAQSSLPVKPKVRTGDFRTLETRDVAENYILTAHEELIHFAYPCVTLK